MSCPYAFRPRRRGMALPVVIVVLLVLTASFAGGVALMRGERVIDDTGIATIRAQAAADAGLQRLIADRAGLGLPARPADPTGSDSLRVDNADGSYTDFITTRLRPASSTTVALYQVRVRAVVTQSTIADAPAAEYTVSQLAAWKQDTMSVRAALVSASGMIKSGNSGTISGVDHCAVTDGGTGHTLPAVSVPVTGATGGAGYAGQTGALEGSPAISYVGANQVEAANALPIRWSGIYEGTSITPTFISDRNGNGFPSADWFAAHPNTFPIILVQNGPGYGGSGGSVFSLDLAGHGLLIVQNDLLLNGSPAGWRGVVMVGGRIQSNGANSVEGATISGLNAQTGGAPEPSDINDLNGNKQFLYNSCLVRQAMSGVGRLRVYAATWSNIAPPPPPAP